MEAEVGDVQTVGSSLNAHSLELNISGDVLSAEDLAWVDSCLISDTNTVDRNWDSLKDVLLEIVNSQPLPHYDSDGSSYSPRETGSENFQSSGVANDDKVNGKKTDQNDCYMEVETSQYDQSIEGLTSPASPIQPNHGYDAQEGTVNSDLDLELLSHVAESPTHLLAKILNDDEVLHPSKGIEAKKAKGKMAVDNNSSGAKAQENCDDQSVNEINFSGNPFRPDYNDNILGSVFVDTDLNAEFSPFKIEPVTDDIFREWELNIPGEEDEFIEQLNKTLEGNIGQALPSSFDDLSANTEESVDSLIAAIKGLYV